MYLVCLNRAASSVLARAHRLNAQSLTQIRLSIWSVVSHSSAAVDSRLGRSNTPALDGRLCKFFISSTQRSFFSSLGSVDDDPHQCLCKEVLRAATKRSGYGEINRYSTYGCILISDILEVSDKKHTRFGDTHWIDQDARISDAVRQMYATDLSALVVMELAALDADKSGTIHPEELVLSAQNDAIVGIVTERDYLNAVAKGQLGIDTKVRHVMTSFKDKAKKKKKLVFTSPEHTALATMEIMTNNRLRHIPVIGSQGFDDDGNPIAPRVLGVVSGGEVLKAILAETRSEVETLESYIHGETEYSAEERIDDHANSNTPSSSTSSAGAQSIKPSTKTRFRDGAEVTT